MFGFTLLKVSGDSMAPRYYAGDFLVVRGCNQPQRLQPGAAVVFQHPDYGLLVKAVQDIDSIQQGLWVQGQHSASVDSRCFGLIPFTAVVGTVMLTIGRAGLKFA